MKKIVASVLILLTCSGCIFSNKPKMKFPSEISSMCYQARNETKAGIEAIDGKKLKEHSETVAYVKGEKKIDGIWAWTDPRWPDWYIGGLCNGTLIQIGCHPNIPGAEVHYGCLFHETGHHWLITNYGIFSHPKKYDSLFNWSWIDEQLSVYKIEKISVDGVGNLK